jgi:4a-hydroxytetrahydrobiopterin dehydratase
MDLLSADEITRELAQTPDWDLVEDAIVKTVTTDDFVTAIALVNRVAAIAEEEGHHPDLTVRWNKVTLTLTSHSAGGLTASDFHVARRLNALV